MKIVTIFLYSLVAAIATLSVNFTEKSSEHNPSSVNYIATVSMCKDKCSKRRYSYGVVVSRDAVLVLSATAIFCDSDEAHCEVFAGGNSKTGGNHLNILKCIVQHPHNHDEIGILRVEIISFPDTVGHIWISRKDIRKKPTNVRIYGFDQNDFVSFGFKFANFYITHYDNSEAIQ